MYGRKGKGKKRSGYRAGARVRKTGKRIRRYGVSRGGIRL